MSCISNGSLHIGNQGFSLVYWIFCTFTCFLQRLKKFRHFPSHSQSISLLLESKWIEKNCFRCQKSCRKNECYQIHQEARFQLHFPLGLRILNVIRKRNRLLKCKIFGFKQGKKTCFFGESAYFLFDCSSYCFGMKESLQRFV